MGYFTNLLKDCAVLITVNGTNENDEPIVIARENINCKIEYQESLVNGSQGQELISSGRLFTERIVKIDDVIEINGRKHKVIKVNPYYPIDGSILVINEVYFA